MIQQIQNKIVEFVAHDKALHFIAGFLLYVLASCFLPDLYCFFLVLLVAFAKEIRDQIVYKGFDISDLIFTMIPALIMLVKNSWNNC